MRNPIDRTFKGIVGRSNDDRRYERMFHGGLPWRVRRKQTRRLEHAENNRHREKT